jgi:glycosyltransferase involved in cell wall biosynthesis
LRGGAERYMFDVAREQRRRGHDVFFFGTDHAENVETEHRRYYPPYHEFAEGRPGLGAALSSVWSREAARCLRAFLDVARPDVAHLHNTAYHLTPSIVAELARAGVPAVMILHDYNLFCPNHYFFSRGEPCYRCAEGHYFSCITRRCVKGKLGASVLGYVAHLVARRTAIYHKLARIITPSNFLRDHARNAGYERVTRMPSVYDVKIGEMLPKEDYFLYAGRLAPEKGIDVLIQAVGLAGSHVRLKVAGSGPVEAELRETAGEYAAGQVEFLGKLGPEALTGEMASARAVVVPSVWPENTPAVVMEALGAGAPIIASRMGGVPEMFDHGVEGLLVEAGDVPGLTAALLELAGDAGRAREMGEAGQRRLARDFSFEKHMTELLDLYREVAA